MKFVPEFAGHGVFVQWHIPSKYNEEMSHKSVVVSLFHMYSMHLYQLTTYKRYHWVCS